jgi:hypothetical protein
MNAVRRLVFLIAPTLPYVLWVNANRISELPDGKDYDEHVADWTKQFGGGGPAERNLAELAYQQAMDRLTGFESKAVGLLTVVGIVAAGGFAACAGRSPAPIVAIAGLGYVASAGLACAFILVPRERRALVMNDLRSPTAGYAELAAAARMTEPLALRASNLLTSATYDLMRSFLITATALGLLVSGG